MARQTFSKWLENNTYTIPTVSRLDTVKATAIEALTRQEIADFFGLRQVVPHFDVFFQRTLTQIYPYYIENLRIDPTISEFDWLVDNYVERQHAQEINATRTPDLKTTTQYGHKVTESGNPKTVKTGNISDKDDGTDTLVKTGTLNHAYRGSETNTKSGSETDTKDGSEQTTHEIDQTTTQSGSEIADHNTAQSKKDVSRAIGYGRTQPMSQSISKLHSTNSSSISIGGNTVEVSYNRNNFPDASILNPSSSTDALTDAGTLAHDIGRNVTSFDDRATKDSGKIVDTTAYNGRSDTRTYDNLTDKKEFSADREDIDTYNDLTDTTNYGKEHTTIYNEVTDEQTLDRKEESSGEDIVLSQGDEINNSKTLDRDISTGRNQNIADLLTGARDYIARSRAWNFLKDQLEPCFFQVYDLDELCYNGDD